MAGGAAAGRFTASAVPNTPAIAAWCHQQNRTRSTCAATSKYAAESSAA
jgi:hypothetical protein